MIPVCKDTEHDGSKSMWFFKEGRYTRLDEKGNLKGSISGQNMPNPNDTWKTRCEASGAVYPSDSVSHPKTGELIRLKPTEASFALFQHWEGLKCQA